MIPCSDAMLPYSALGTEAPHQLTDAKEADHDQHDDKQDPMGVGDHIVISA